MNKYYIHSFFTITTFVNLIHHAILLMRDEKCMNKYR